MSAHRAALADLQSKTWDLELATDGKNRWIILPKGNVFGDTGDTKDGRKAIFVK